MANDIRIGVQMDTSGARTGFREIDRATSGLASTFNTLSRAMTTPVGMVATLAGASIAAAVGMKKLADSTATFADNIGKAAQRMDVSIEFYQKMTSAASHAGTSMATMETAMRTMLRTMAQVDDGNKRMGKVYSDLGVSIKDSNGNFRDQETVFKETLIALSKMENHTERNAVAQKLLGKAANELAPLFNEGAAAVKKYVKENDSAVIVSKKMAASAALYNDTMQTISETIKKTNNESLEPFMESISQLAQIMLESDSFQYFLDWINVIGTSISNVAIKIADIARENTEIAIEEGKIKLDALEKSEKYYIDEITRYKGLAAKEQDERERSELQRQARLRSEDAKSIADERIALAKKIARKEAILNGTAFTPTKFDHDTDKTTTNIDKLTNSMIKLTTAFERAQNIQSAYTSGMKLFQEGMGEAFKGAFEATEMFAKRSDGAYSGITHWISTGVIASNSYSDAINKMNSNINKLTKEKDKLITSMDEEFATYTKLNKQLNNSGDLTKEDVAKIKEKRDSKLKLVKIIASEINAIDKQTGAYKANRTALQELGGEARQMAKDDVYSNIAKDITDGLLTTEQALNSLNRVSRTTGKTFLTSSLNLEVDVDPKEVEEGLKKYIKKINTINDTFNNEVSAKSLIHNNKLLSIQSSYSSNLFKNIKNNNTIRKNEQAVALAELQNYTKDKLLLEITDSEKSKEIWEQYYTDRNNMQTEFAATNKAATLANLTDTFTNVSRYAGMTRDAIFSIGDQIAEGRRARYDTENEDLTKSQKAELKNFRGSDRAREALQSKHDAEMDALAKKQAKEERDLKMKRMWVDAFVNGAMGFAQAVGQLGFPAGPIVGGIMQAALLTNAAIAQGQANSQAFATGGVVDGNQFSGDNVNAKVNSGEMILNQRQINTTQKLFDRIDSGEVGGSSSSVSIHIENFSGHDEDLTRLEDKLVELQSNNRISNVLFA